MFLPNWNVFYIQHDYSYYFKNQQFKMKILILLSFLFLQTPQVKMTYNRTVTFTTFKDGTKTPDKWKYKKGIIIINSKNLIFSGKTLVIDSVRIDRVCTRLIIHPKKVHGYIPMVYVFYENDKIKWIEIDPAKDEVEMYFP